MIKLAPFTLKNIFHWLFLLPAGCKLLIVPKLIVNNLYHCCFTGNFPYVSGQLSFRTLNILVILRFCEFTVFFNFTFFQRNFSVTQLPISFLSLQASYRWPSNVFNITLYYTHYMTTHFCFQIRAGKCKLGFSRTSRNHRCSRRIEANQFIYRATHLERKIAVVKNER